jgi:hypothetical protein
LIKNGVSCTCIAAAPSNKLDITNQNKRRYL